MDKSIDEDAFIKFPDDSGVEILEQSMIAMTREQEETLLGPPQGHRLNPEMEALFRGTNICDFQTEYEGYPIHMDQKDMMQFGRMHQHETPTLYLERIFGKARDLARLEDRECMQDLTPEAERRLGIQADNRVKFRKMCLMQFSEEMNVDPPGYSRTDQRAISKIPLPQIPFVEKRYTAKHATSSTSASLRTKRVCIEPVGEDADSDKENQDPEQHVLQ
jgi:hypothetical protein